MLSTLPSHQSKTTHLRHDPCLASLASFSRPSRATIISLTSPSAGRERVLSTVLEASSSEATTPDLLHVHVGPQPPAALAALVPVPPVPVPPRRSSVSVSVSVRPSPTNKRPSRISVAPTSGTKTINVSEQHQYHQYHQYHHHHRQEEPQEKKKPQQQQQRRRRHRRRRHHHDRAHAGAASTSVLSSSSSSSSSFSSISSSASSQSPPHAASNPSLAAAHVTPAASPPLPHSHVPASLSSSASASSRRRRLLAPNASSLDAPTIRHTMDADMADIPTARTPPRDSHDLSLSPRDVTRDSLVTNMLRSLDQMAFGQPSAQDTFGDDRTPSSTYESAVSSQRRVEPARSYHWRQASYGSELEASIVGEDQTSRSARGRRSTSGSNHGTPSHGARLNNVRERSSSRAPPEIPPRHQSARSGRHSTKSSSSASVDMGYPSSVATQRIVQRTGRSASIDCGPQQSQIEQLSLSSPFRVDFPETFANAADYAAAPTPTVHGGPRREMAGLAIPKPPPEPVDARSIERGRTASRSAKSSAEKVRRGTSNHTVTRSTPVLPSVEMDAAPAPSVGYGKSKKTDVAGTLSAPQQKDRPGFFRRVFGSSKNSAPSNGGLPTSHTSTSRLPTSLERTTQQQQPVTPSLSTHTGVPSWDTYPSHPHTPLLQKKSSSFFRRRKKSVVEEARPRLNLAQAPPLPQSYSANFQQAKSAAPPQNTTTSPTSSSCQVMHPYLRDKAAAGLGLSGNAAPTPLSDITNTAYTKSQTHGETRRTNFKREFSPDYQPSPNAHIRRVSPEADGEAPRSTPSPRSKTSQGRLRASSSFLDLDAGSDQENESNATPTRGDRQRAAEEKSNEEAREATIREGKNQDRDEADRASAPNRPNAPVDGARARSFASGSTETGYKTAPSAPPSVLVEEPGEPEPSKADAPGLMKTPKSLDEPDYIIGEPTEDDHQKARRIYDGGEDFIQKDKAAAWMGEQGPVRQRTLQAYMAMYEFHDLSILSALRQVCGRLVLRGETQQVDRILVAFSKRWGACNPKHGFKAIDVIHTICYSIMLLNTDLHVADIEQKMTRGQFVKNTMTTILQALAESAPSAFVRPSILPEKSSTLNADAARHGADHGRSSRHSFRPPLRSDTNSSDVDDCGPLVRSAFHGSMRVWQEQVETVLKSIYSSIREERLPLFGAEREGQLPPAPSQGSLSVLSMLKRSPSVMSKAPSETQGSTRGRVADSGRTSTSRWASKSRSRPGLGRTGLSSSRTSFDDGNSIWSPAMSSATWSRHSLGRTQASMSQDSFASSMPRGDYQQSIGFATALSQAIIRDEDAAGHDDAPSLLSADLGSTQFLEDESLELAGPPWVKEGMVVHKHHLDGYGKRAKDRNWSEVFAVVQKGHISLFSFNASRSMRQRSRLRSAGKPSGPVGGGNWQDNAVSLGTFNLRLTLASALPPPGYSRSRPHVWALSLPTGAVHLFQVGTPEIIREFVNTANYWSARLSTHPLVGGISNIEYGWSAAIVNSALVSASNKEPAAPVADAGAGVGRPSGPGSGPGHGRKSSLAGASLRGTSFEHVSGAFTNNSGRGKLPGDRIHVAEWAPPTQSMRPSNASEAEQLQALVKYVKGIEEELQCHNQLRGPMMLAFTPRGHNAGRAMANWERKSAYLLHEIVKFRTYVDCLQQAEVRKREIYTEREAAQKAARGGEGAVEEDDADETLRP